MNVEQLIEIAYRQKKEYIMNYDTVEEGIESFNCLILLIEERTITETNIEEYGIILP